MIKSMRCAVLAVATCASLAVPATSALAATTPPPVAVTPAPAGTPGVTPANLTTSSAAADLATPDTISGGPYSICDQSGTGWCLDSGAHSPTAGSTLVTFADGTAYRWDADDDGTVSNSGAWPFTGGSGWNHRYNGDEVILLKYNDDTSLCATGSTSLDESTDLNLEPCSGTGFSAEQLIVISGGWWINVAITDGQSSSGNPAVLAADCAGPSSFAEFVNPSGWGTCEVNWDPTS